MTCKYQCDTCFEEFKDDRKFNIALPVFCPTCEGKPNTVIGETCQTCEHLLIYETEGHDRNIGVNVCTKGTHRVIDSPINQYSCDDWKNCNGHYEIVNLTLNDLLRKFPEARSSLFKLETACQDGQWGIADILIERVRTILGDDFPQDRRDRFHLAFNDVLNDNLKELPDAIIELEEYRSNEKTMRDKFVQGLEFMNTKITDHMEEIIIEEAGL